MQNMAGPLDDLLAAFPNGWIEATSTAKALPPSNLSDEASSPSSSPRSDAMPARDDDVSSLSRSSKKSALSSTSLDSAELTIRSLLAELESKDSKIAGGPARSAAPAASSGHAEDSFPTTIAPISSQALAGLPNLFDMEHSASHDLFASFPTGYQTSRPDLNQAAIDDLVASFMPQFPTEKEREKPVPGTGWYAYDTTPARLGEVPHERPLTISKAEEASAAVETEARQTAQATQPKAVETAAIPLPGPSGAPSTLATSSATTPSPPSSASRTLHGSPPSCGSPFARRPGYPSSERSHASASTRQYRSEPLNGVAYAPARGQITIAGQVQQMKARKREARQLRKGPRDRDGTTSMPAAPPTSASAGGHVRSPSSDADDSFDQSSRRFPGASRLPFDNRHRGLGAASTGSSSSSNNSDNVYRGSDGKYIPQRLLPDQWTREEVEADTAANQRAVDEAARAAAASRHDTRGPTEYAHGWQPTPPWETPSFRSPNRPRGVDSYRPDYSSGDGRQPRQRSDPYAPVSGSNAAPLGERGSLAKWTQEAEEAARSAQNSSRGAPPPPRVPAPGSLASNAIAEVAADEELDEYRKSFEIQRLGILRRKDGRRQL